MNQDQFYIQRCLQIAKLGLGSTRPNPSVGCIIVYNNIIIGEGYTSSYGNAHAEVNAINSVMDKSLLSKATLYVTLEPCSHYGKTPPCCNLIIKHNIPKVVIGCLDDNPEVSGNGVKKLKASGVNVIVGVLQDKCKQHHKRFLTYQTKKRPFIILKWAQSNDGFIAPKTKEKQAAVWISNELSRQLTHKWRSEEHAILIGTNTAIQDNPTLTTRHWKGNNPIRIVLDRTLRLNQTLNVFNKNSKTLVITNFKQILNLKKNTICNFKCIDWSNTNSIAQQICNVLHKQQIQSVIIEGGTQTLQTFINENLWDEARVFKSTVNLNNGIKAPILNAQAIKILSILQDTLTTYKND